MCWHARVRRCNVAAPKVPIRRANRAPRNNGAQTGTHHHILLAFSLDGHAVPGIITCVHHGSINAYAARKLLQLGGRLGRPSGQGRLREGFWWVAVPYSDIEQSLTVVTSDERLRTARSHCQVRVVCARCRLYGRRTLFDGYHRYPSTVTAHRTRTRTHARTHARTHHKHTRTHTHTGVCARVLRE